LVCLVNPSQLWQSNGTSWCAKAATLILPSKAMRLSLTKTKSILREDLLERFAHDPDELSKVQHMLTSLKSAISRLYRAHYLYTKETYEELPDEWEDEEEVDGDMNIVQLPRHLERLQIVRRSLEDVLNLEASSGEDELVQTSCHQHEMAMHAREQAEARYACEERLVGRLRHDIIEMQRSIKREARVQERLGTASETTRERATKQKNAAMEVEKDDLHTEAQTIAEALGDSIIRNREIKVRISEVDQALSFAAAENLKAQKALGIHNPESYRKAKDRERTVANWDLVNLAKLCNQQITQLQSEWSQTEARYHAEMSELHEEVQSLHKAIQEKQTQAQDHLTKQSSAWSQTHAEVDKKMNQDIVRLDALCMRQASEVHRAKLNSRERVEEHAIGTQRRKDAALREVNLTFKTRRKLEERMFADNVVFEHKAVQDAKHEAEWWAKRANRMRENYKAHAVKSGAYVKQLDPQSRQELMRFYSP